MTAPDDDSGLLPSVDDIAFYREHGYFISPHIVPHDVLDEALRGVHRHFAGERDDELAVVDGFADWQRGDDERLRNVEYLSLRNRQVRALALYPMIGAIAARLAGTDTIRLWDDQLIWKEPSGADDRDAVVGWHTDRAYWMTCTSESMLTAWIPLQDCSADMGPLLVLDGSHRWADTDDLRSFRNTDLGAVGSRIDPDRAGAATRSMVLEKGQVSFHHCRTVHASGANRSTQARVSLAVHLQDGANRWRPFYNKQGERWQLVNDRLAQCDANNNPNYTDPAVFPVLWADA